MEWRHTLEILTKDIQDIEKLVGNLQNSADSPSIDLDLAMSKLRNVYEVLTMIREDQMAEKRSLQASGPVRAAGDPTSVAPAPESGPEETDHGSANENEAQAAPPAEGGKAILAEKFAAASSINDNLAGKRPAGTEAKLAGKPIDNIHRNIGINDRFLIIRELFKGDADSFRALINELDEAGDMQRATELLRQRFPDPPDHEGLDILEGLIKRRFTTV